MVYRVHGNGDVNGHQNCDVHSNTLVMMKAIVSGGGGSCDGVEAAGNIVDGVALCVASAVRGVAGD